MREGRKGRCTHLAFVFEWRTKAVGYLIDFFLLVVGFSFFSLAFSEHRSNRNHFVDVNEMVFLFVTQDSCAFFMTDTG